MGAISNNFRQIQIRGPMPRTYPRTLLAIVSFCLICSLSAAHAQDNPAAKPAPKPAPVLAGEAVRGSLPILIPAVGAVEAGAVVEIKARISGLLRAVHFTEGQDVRQGDLLFSIDSRDLEADLRSARANLERSRSHLAKAEEDKRRYDNLLSQGMVSRDQQESTATTLAALQAEIRSAEAAVEAAKVELSFAEIRSPITGRTGALQMDAGNMVKANADSPMVVISQVAPVNVRFSVPESHLGAIMAGQQAAALTVTAKPAGAPAATGKLVFIDSSVDSRTGTIALKAQFPNTDRTLWPGQFTDVTLMAGTRNNVVLVPAQAVTPGAEGEFVYIIRPDSTVEYRLVKTGPRQDGHVVVESGLEGGEKIVLDGHLRLSPGATVTIRDPQAKDAKPDDAPQGKARDAVPGAKL
jgi:multidrug efflux system membrane fusion protein